MEQFHANIENFTTLTHPQYQIALVALMVAYGAHLAFAPFFLANAFQIAPRYRLVPIISATVMLAAGISLLREFSVFKESYIFNGAVWEPVPGLLHSNAYRYANWLITIPLLLAQLLIAMQLTKTEFGQRYPKLVIAAVLMIVTGLVGQFYEATSITTMLVWGAISTLPFLFLVKGILDVLFIGRNRTPMPIKAWPGNLFFYFLGFWGLYALAYMVPAFSDGGSGVVARQMMFSVADLASKLVYGVILARFCLRLSAMEGYEPAVAALMPEGEKKDARKPKTAGAAAEAEPQGAAATAKS